MTTLTMNHTLVIPTYNRPDLVRRLVGYYLKRNTPIQLLVLDSSKAVTAAANGVWFSSCGPTVRHMVFSETLPVASKLALGLDHVHTPYASFCADDDLVFPQGLEDALQFLDGHPDYVCAHGLYLNFQVHEGRDDLNIWREYGGPGNEANHPGARVFRLFQNYESLFYAAFRTQDLKDIFGAVQTLPSLHYQELFQSVAALIKGKVHRIPHLYAARQSCAAAQPERDNWQTFYWFADDAAELLNQYQNYCEVVWTFYEKHAASPRLKRKAFQQALDLAHAVYFSAGCPPEYFYSRLQANWPDDPFVQPTAVDLGQLVLRYCVTGKVHSTRTDLFDRLGKTQSKTEANAVTPGRLPVWNPYFLLATLKPIWRLISSAPYCLNLDRQARRQGGRPWKCKLPLTMRHLAAIPEFRNTYLQLCLYLDGQ